MFAWQVPFSSLPGLYDREALEKASKEFLIETVSAVAPKPEVPLLPLVAEGDAAEALIAASKGANLLVLGTRGRSRLAGLLLGSVSQVCAAAGGCGRSGGVDMSLMAWFSGGDGWQIRSSARRGAPACVSAVTAWMRSGASAGASAAACAQDVRMVSSPAASRGQDGEPAGDGGGPVPVRAARTWWMVTSENSLPFSAGRRPSKLRRVARAGDCREQDALGTGLQRDLACLLTRGFPQCDHG